MHQGLIAQWHRGVAAQGVAGAALLSIPVLVAATIGVGGGIGGGLSSLATGPSDIAIGDAPTQTKGIDRLTTTLPSLTRESSRSDAARSRDRGSRPGDLSPGGGAGTPVSEGGPAGGDTGGGGSGGGAGGGNAPTGNPPADEPPPPPGDTTGIGVGVDNGVSQILQGLGLEQ